MGNLIPNPILRIDSKLPICSKIEPLYYTVQHSVNIHIFAKLFRPFYLFRTFLYCTANVANMISIYSLLKIALRTAYLGTHTLHKEG